MRYLKTYKLFEDVGIDKSNIQKLGAEQIFDDDLIKTISDMCLELDDLGYQVNIHFPEYHKEINSNTEILPCLCVDITSQSGHFLDNRTLEVTIREIESYVSEFDLNVDIELGSDDQFVTADDFIKNYNVEELDVISILIYSLNVENLRNFYKG